jgi:hypothetical protein
MGLQPNYKLDNTIIYIMIGCYFLSCYCNFQCYYKSWLIFNDFDQTSKKRKIFCHLYTIKIIILKFDKIKEFIDTNVLRLSKLTDKWKAYNNNSF